MTNKVQMVDVIERIRWGILQALGIVLHLGRVLPTSSVNTLITQLLIKWKKALEIFQKHSVSEYHKSSVLHSKRSTKTRL